MILTISPRSTMSSTLDWYCHWFIIWIFTFGEFVAHWDLCWMYPMASTNHPMSNKFTKSEYSNNESVTISIQGWLHGAISNISWKKFRIKYTAFRSEFSKKSWRIPYEFQNHLIWNKKAQSSISLMALYRVSHIETYFMNWLWQIEIC